MKKTYNSTTTTEWVCTICGGKIITIINETNEIHEFLSRSLQARADWPNPKFIEKKDTICSLQCFNKHKEKIDKKYYDERIFGIPIKYRNIEADKKLVAENYGVNLFITGKSGAGKTVLAAGIVKECVKNRHPYKWVNYPQFIMELQNMYRSDKESPFDRADEIANFDGLLVIDDIGAEKMTEWVRQITYFIINEREQNCLSILLTSNFSLEQMADMIDVRISSRIAGMCKSVKLNGIDRRLEKSDKTWQAGEVKISKGYNIL